MAAPRMERPSGLERVVLASNNAGKLREFSSLLGNFGIELIPQGKLGIPEAPEPFPTFVENALAKARHAAQWSGLPALADDSGLCVAALKGAPGVYSARYAERAGREKSDAANNAYLLEQLAAFNEPHSRQAYFFCVLVLVRASDDPEPMIAEGRWHGEVLHAARGPHGFGYDPLFNLPQLGASAAELSPEVKNLHSHRALALKHLRERFFEMGLGSDSDSSSNPGLDPANGIGFGST